MTVIVKSNIPYAGAANLTPIAQVTQSAQDLYDAYEARVTEDGGIITDASATLAAITSALEHGYFYRCSAAISARWGVKLSGSNIVKLYNLVGSVDGVVTNVIEKDTTHESWATAKFDASGDLITFTGLTVNKSGKMAFVGSSGDHSSVSNGLFAQFTPVAQAWTFGEYDAIVTINAVTQIDADNAIPDNGANGVYMEQTGSGGRYYLLVDGVLRETATQTFTNLADDATANYVLKMNTGPVYLNEWWHMHDATYDTYANLNLDVANRY